MINIRRTKMVSELGTLLDGESFSTMPEGGDGEIYIVVTTDHLAQKEGFEPVMRLDTGEIEYMRSTRAVRLVDLDVIVTGRPEGAK